MAPVLQPSVGLAALWLVNKPITDSRCVGHQLAVLFLTTRGFLLQLQVKLNHQSFCNFFLQRTHRGRRQKKMPPCGQSGGRGASLAVDLVSLIAGGVFFLCVCLGGASVVEVEGRAFMLWVELRRGRGRLKFVVMRPTETAKEKKLMEQRNTQNIVLHFSFFFFIKSFTSWQKYALCEIKTEGNRWVGPSSHVGLLLCRSNSAFMYSNVFLIFFINIIIIAVVNWILKWSTKRKRAKLSSWVTSSPWEVLQRDILDRWPQHPVD